MFGLGLGELVVIMVVVILIFGGSRLPELGRGLGEGLRSFRDALRADAGRPKRPEARAPAQEEPPPAPREQKPPAR